MAVSVAVLLLLQLRRGVEGSTCTWFVSPLLLACVTDVVLHCLQMSRLQSTCDSSMVAEGMRGLPEWDGLKALIDEMMAPNAADRPRMKEAMQRIDRLHCDLHERESQ